MKESKRSPEPSGSGDLFDINGLYFRKDYLIDIVKYHHFWHFRYWQKL